MPKATLMVRFRRPDDPAWIWRPAAYGSTGRVRAGFAVFKDPKTREVSFVDIGDLYTYDVRIEDGGTTYEPAGKNAADADGRCKAIAAKLAAKTQSTAAGLIVIDPEKETKKKLRIDDGFDDYIQDAFKRNALEAREQAQDLEKCSPRPEPDRALFQGNPNSKLLKMIKRLARRAKVVCGHCPNCIAGLKGDRGCDEFELHKFRRTCITTWLRNKLDPRTVMEYAGHADLETTLRYLRPAAAEERIAEVSGIKWY